MPHMQYLIQAWEHQGWTQQELADRLGVSRLTVSRWEQGEMRPRTPMRRQVALLLEQPEDILLQHVLRNCFGMRGGNAAWQKSKIGEVFAQV